MVDEFIIYIFIRQLIEVVDIGLCRLQMLKCIEDKISNGRKKKVQHSNSVIHIRQQDCVLCIED